MTAKQENRAKPTSDALTGTTPLRSIPSVHELVESAPLAAWSGRAPRPWIVDTARRELDAYRKDLLTGPSAQHPLTVEQLAERVAAELHHQQRPNLRPLINATGIILHTGLGRAPLAKEVVAALSSVGDQYASVEIDLETGHRGKRSTVVADLLCRLTGAEAAVVVNNNAAATLLVLAALAGPQSNRPRQVIVSRGELIEIGGSFRLPQIMEVSGAVLREVGTTNKTHLRDYKQAIDLETTALMKVHTSNYRVLGFTDSVSIEELVRLGQEHDLPVIHDIGSGAMLDFEQFGLEDEPRASASITAGADLVLFSADKLLGGPQAGIVLGKTRWVSLLERHPLMRPLRVDKLTLAALEATLRLHRDPKLAIRTLPVLAMAATPVSQLQARARHLVRQLQPLVGVYDVQVQPATAFLGGGSLPTRGIESVAIRLQSSIMNETQLAARLRSGDLAVVPRVQDGAVWLDLRTVFPQQDESLVSAVREACGKTP